jgi:hypothetical protein
MAEAMPFHGAFGGIASRCLRKGAGAECPPHTCTGRMPCSDRVEVRLCRGPFGFAQGRLFDSASRFARRIALLRSG